jgi:hypothetical protein
VAVILPDGSYSVRKRPHEFGRDAHGTPLPTSPGGRTWVVATALLKVNNAAADVDYVAVTAQLEPPERI